MEGNRLHLGSSEDPPHAMKSWLLSKRLSAAAAICGGGRVAWEGRRMISTQTKLQHVARALPDDHTAILQMPSSQAAEEDLHPYKLQHVAKVLPDDHTVR